jgi:hypothetical protein
MMSPAESTKVVCEVPKQEAPQSYSFTAMQKSNRLQMQ